MILEISQSFVRRTVAWAGPICGKVVQGSSSGGKGRARSVERWMWEKFRSTSWSLWLLSFYWLFPCAASRWFLLAQFPHPWLAACELAVEMQQKAHAAMQNSPRIRNFSCRLRIGTAPASKTGLLPKNTREKQHQQNTVTTSAAWIVELGFRPLPKK